VISKNFKDIEDATAEFINRYKSLEFLWKETLEESFKAFLDSGVDPRAQEHKKINDDGEEEEDETFKWMAEKILDGVQTKKPSLEVFDEKITFLTSIKTQISEMKNVVDIGWLRVNSKPLIDNLQITVSLWISTYTNFLLDNTTKEVANIEKFIKEVAEGIKVAPTGSAT